MGWIQRSHLSQPRPSARTGLEDLQCPHYVVAHNAPLVPIRTVQSIITKGECNKWHNLETKLAKRNMRHAEMKHWQDKAN